MRSWKYIISTLFVGTLILIASESLTNSSGPGGGDTNAPGETNCTRCHTGTLITSGSNWNNLKMSNNFTGGGYIPDSTYDLTVEYTQSGKSKWGFQITILDKDNKKVGTLTSKGNRNQKRTKTISGAQREYIEHTSTGTASTSTGKTDWTFEWKAPSSNLGDLTAYVVVNAANGSGTGGDQIYAKKFTLSPSSLLPTASATASDTVVCEGTTVNFTGSATSSPTGWDWDIDGGSPNSSTSQNPKAVFNKAGEYKVTLIASNSKGKSLADTVKIEVLASPTSEILGAATREMCKGGSVQLTASFNPTYSYKWSNGKTGNKITVTDTGSYYVTTTFKTCSKLSNVVRVTHFASPKVSLTSDASGGEACEKDLVNFTTDAGYDSVYVYKNFNLVQTIDTHKFSLAMADTANFNVKVLDNNGCISDFSDTVKVNVDKPYEAPTVSCNSVTQTSATFGWTFNGHPKGYQISMDTGKTWTIASSGPTGLTHTANGLTPERSYTLMVRAIKDGPCVFGEPGSAICKTSSCNTLDLTHKYDTAICFGDSVRVEINGLKGQRYSLSFDNNPSFQDTIFYFSPDFTHTHTVFVTDSNASGCPAEELNLDVRVDKIGMVKLRTQYSNNQFCSGEIIRFTATEGMEDYYFYVNDTLRAQTKDSFYLEAKYNNGDSAYVVATKGVCSVTSEKIGILVYPPWDAGFTYTYENGEVKFKMNNENVRTIDWDFGDGKISTTPSPSHKYNQSFEGDSVWVKLCVTTPVSCFVCDSMKVYIPMFSNVNEVVNENYLRAYPNPTGSTVQLKLANGSLAGSEITIYSITGREVYSLTATKSTETINVEEWNAGMYLIKVKTESNKTYHKRLLVE